MRGLRHSFALHTCALHTCAPRTLALHSFALHTRAPRSLVLRFRGTALTCSAEPIIGVRGLFPTRIGNATHVFHVQVSGALGSLKHLAQLKGGFGYGAAALDDDAPVGQLLARIRQLSAHALKLAALLDQHFQQVDATQAAQLPVGERRYVVMKLIGLMNLMRLIELMELVFVLTAERLVRGRYARIGIF